jgi:hypothetical protein
MLPAESRRWIRRALLLGLAVRLVHLLAIAGSTIPRWQQYTAQGDFSIAWRWAAQIRGGDWLGRPPYHPDTAWMRKIGSPEDWARWWGGLQTYHQAPLYPYLVAAVARPGGGSPLPIFVLQALLGLACIPLVAWLASRWAGPRAGVIAAFLWALARPEIALEAFLLRDAVALPLLLGALCLLERLRSPPGRPMIALGAGLLLGAATLDRENILPLALAAVPLAGWLWLRDGPEAPRPAHRVRAAALAAAGLTLAFTPLLARNLAVGAPAAALSNRGPEVILHSLSIAPGADPVGINLFPALRGQLEEARGSTLRACFIVLRDGLHQPDRFGALLGRKALAWLSAGEPADNVELDYLALRSPVLKLCLPTWAVLGPALLGVAVSLTTQRRRRSVGLWAFALLTLPLMGSIVLWRIRAGTLPVLVPFAALGLDFIWDNLREPASRRRAGLLQAAGVAAFVLVSLFALPAPAWRLRPYSTDQSAVIRLDEGDAGTALSEIDEYLALARRGLAEPSPELLELRARILAAAERPAGQEAPADLVLLHGNVLTLDAQRPRAQAIAVRGDRIAAVGPDEEIQKLASPATKVIDLRGRLAIPGFIEGHGHYLGLGESKLVLDLTRAKSWDDIVAQVEEAVRKAKPGEVIQGRGWHQEKWNRPPQPNVEGVPLHASLDRVSPANPVVLEHASGHAAFANAQALKLAGVTRRTANPAGGEIVKDAAGEPTGLLKESAQLLVREAIARLPRSPEEVEARFRQMAELAGAEALSKGVTTFHDAGASFETIDRYKRLADEGKLPVRLYVMVRFQSDASLDADLDRYRLTGYGRGMLTVRAIKEQVDGALGSHGAWLLEPYADLPISTGLVLKPMADFERTARIALRHGFQVATHAIGDRANREVLDVYERIFRDHPERRDLRWRIEHAQHLQPSDVPRFHRLGVIASMQGVHITSDGPWVAKRLGEERARRTSYLWRSLIDSGAVVTNGTDTPVEDIDPILSFYGAVSRRTKEGKVFVSEQRVSREEALRAYTLDNAWAAFEEKEKGSLFPGKLADIAVLSKDILTVPEEQIPSARVDLTILGGVVRASRD